MAVTASCRGVPRGGRKVSAAWWGGSVEAGRGGRAALLHYLQPAQHAGAAPRARAGTSPRTRRRCPAPPLVARRRGRARAQLDVVGLVGVRVRRAPSAPTVTPARRVRDARSARWAEDRRRRRVADDDKVDAVIGLHRVRRRRPRRQRAEEDRHHAELRPGPRNGSRAGRGGGGGGGSYDLEYYVEARSGRLLGRRFR